jgi:hypothetical protein
MAGTFAEVTCFGCLRRAYYFYKRAEKVTPSYAMEKGWEIKQRYRRLEREAKRKP